MSKSNYRIESTKAQMKDIFNRTGLIPEDSFRKAYIEDFDAIYLDESSPSINTLCRIYIIVFISLAEKYNFKGKINRKNKKILKFRNAYMHGDNDSTNIDKDFFSEGNFLFSEKIFMRLVKLKNELLKNNAIQSGCEIYAFLDHLEATKGFSALKKAKFMKLLLLSSIISVDFEWQVKNHYRDSRETIEISKFLQSEESNKIRSSKLYSEIEKQLLPEGSLELGSDLFSESRNLFLLIRLLRNYFIHPKEERLINNKDLFKLCSLPESLDVDDKDLERIYNFRGRLNNLLFIVKENSYAQGINESTGLFLTKDGITAPIKQGMQIKFAPEFLKTKVGRMIVS